MANMAKRAQAIRVDVNAREKVAKMLDNRKIMDQCRCMHRDERNGIALKSNGQENSDVRICAVCGKPIKMKRATFEEVAAAVKTLDVYLDQQKIIMGANASDEQINRLAGLQQDVIYIGKLNEISSKNNPVKQKKDRNNDRQKSNSGWNNNGVGGWRD